MKKETKELDFLIGKGYTPLTDLSFSWDDRIEFYIGYKGNEAAIVAFMYAEDTYMLSKEDLKAMAETAKTQGIKNVKLFTNYGCELHSRYDKPECVGLNQIEKIKTEWE